MNPLRSGALAALAISLSTLAVAQTPAPKADAGKPVPKKAASTEKSDPDVALARKAALDWLALVDASKFEATWDDDQWRMHREAESRATGPALRTPGSTCARSLHSTVPRQAGRR